MQKFLWIAALFIALFGFYFAYEKTYPEKCTPQGMNNYVMEQLGPMSLVQREDPATIRNLQYQYIRNNKCNTKKKQDQRS